MWSWLLMAGACSGCWAGDGGSATRGKKKKRRSGSLRRWRRQVVQARWRRTWGRERVVRKKPRDRSERIVSWREIGKKLGLGFTYLEREKGILLEF